MRISYRNCSVLCPLETGSIEPGVSGSDHEGAVGGGGIAKLAAFCRPKFGMPEVRGDVRRSTGDLTCHHLHGLSSGSRGC